MEMKKEVAEQENICTALLTAGVVLSMACLKHFSAVSSLIEQWRAWVFLFLNVVLIAVYFTSARPSSREDQDFKIRRGGKSRIRGKKKAKRVYSDVVFELHKYEEEIKNCVVKEVVVEETKRACSTKTEEKEKGCLFVKKTAEDGADDKEDEYVEPGRLSNEELNERVEAFITTFRQHLVLDARRGRDKREVPRRREAEPMRSNDKGLGRSNINFSSREVTCSV